MLAQSSHRLLQEFVLDNAGGLKVCSLPLSVAKVSAETLGLCLSRSRTGTTVLQPSVPSHPHLLYCSLRTDTENIHPLAVFLASLPFSCVVPCLFSLLSCSMSPLLISLRLRLTLSFSTCEQKQWRPRVWSSCSCKNLRVVNHQDSAGLVCFRQGVAWQNQTHRT